MKAPQRIGPYLLEAELGRGGMGVVYRARHPELPRPLALKLIRPDLADEEALLRFGREALLMARITHPGLVRVHQLGRAPEGPFIVSELIEGQGLDALAARGAIDSRRAAELVAALAEALGALHAAGVVHRDLKPANVRVRPDGSPVVLDLGIAHDASAERLTVTGQMIGTPAYMSPEQAAGERSTVGPASDVYGLGAILFELLAGERPFADRDGMSVITAIFQHEPRWPAARPEREVPPELDAVVRKAMAKEPSARYPSAAALGEDLARYLAGEVPLAAGELARERARARRTQVAALAAGVVGILAVGGLIAARIEPDAPPTDAAARRVPDDTPEETLAEALGERDALARARAVASWVETHGRDALHEAVRAQLLQVLPALKPHPLRVFPTRSRAELLVTDASDPPLAVLYSGSDAVAASVLDVLTWPEGLARAPSLVTRKYFQEAVARRGEVLLVSGQCETPSGRPHQQAELWRLDPAAGRPPNPIALPDDGLQPGALAVSPSGDRVAICLNQDGRARGKLLLLDGERLEPLAAELQPPSEDFSVFRVAYVREDLIVYAGGVDFSVGGGLGTVVAWNPHTRERVALPRRGPIYVLELSPDRKRLLIGTHETQELFELKVADLVERGERAEVRSFFDPRLERDPNVAPEGHPPAHRAPLHALCFSPDGQRIYTVAAKRDDDHGRASDFAELKVWAAATGSLLAARTDHPGMLYSVNASHPVGIVTAGEYVRANRRVLELWPIGPP